MHLSPRIAAERPLGDALRTCALLVSGLSAVLQGAQVVAAPLQVIGADVPPLVYLQNERAEGFCVDVVRELQRRTQDPAAIQILPWPRVMTQAMTEADILVTCPKRTEERERQFHWIGPVFVSKTFIYVLRDSGLRASTLEEVKALRGVLVPRASYSHELLKSKGFTNLIPTIGTGLTQLKMLMAGREPAMVLEERQVDALLRQAGLPLDSLAPAYLAVVAESYLAFSRGTSETRVLDWQRAMADMKKDGSFERIYRRWFIERPPQELLRPQRALSAHGEVAPVPPVSNRQQ